MFEPVTKTLVCPVCGDVIAHARYRGWPGNLTLSAVGGYPINPTAAGVLRRIAERELADATGPAARDLAEARVELIDRSSAELIYDLTCGRGHSTLRTAPQITRAMKQTPGDWVDLS
jgi:hypothetical protein